MDLRCDASAERAVPARGPVRSALQAARVAAEGSDPDEYSEANLLFAATHQNASAMLHSMLRAAVEAQSLAKEARERAAKAKSR